MSEPDSTIEAPVELAEDVMVRMAALQNVRDGFFDGGEWRISINFAGPLAMVFLTRISTPQRQLACNCLLGKITSVSGFDGDAPEAEAMKFLSDFFHPETGVKTEVEMHAEAVSAPSTTADETLDAGDAGMTSAAADGVVENADGRVSTEVLKKIESFADEKNHFVWFESADMMIQFRIERLGNGFAITLQPRLGPGHFGFAGFNVMADGASSRVNFGREKCSSQEVKNGSLEAAQFLENLFGLNGVRTVSDLRKSFSEAGGGPDGYEERETYGQRLELIGQTIREFMGNGRYMAEVARYLCSRVDRSMSIEMDDLEYVLTVDSRNHHIAVSVIVSSPRSSASPKTLGEAKVYFSRGRDGALVEREFSGEEFSGGHSTNMDRLGRLFQKAARKYSDEIAIATARMA